MNTERDFMIDVEHIVTAVILSQVSRIWLPEIPRKLYSYIFKHIYEHKRTHTEQRKRNTKANRNNILRMQTNQSTLSTTN